MTHANKASLSFSVVIIFQSHTSDVFGQFYYCDVFLFLLQIFVVLFSIFSYHSIIINNNNIFIFTSHTQKVQD